MSLFPISLKVRRHQFVYPAICVSRRLFPKLQPVGRASPVSETGDNMVVSDMASREEHVVSNKET